VRLALLHQTPGAVPPPRDSVLWRTCLRDVIFLDSRHAAAPGALVDSSAYAVLVEIVCGLRSPLIGETEVQAQFKAFLTSLDPRTQGALIRVGQRILADAKVIRHRHLQGFGAHSYGGLVSGHVPPGARVVLVGTGALATEIAAKLGSRHPIDQWGRHAPPDRPAPATPEWRTPHFRLFAEAGRDAVHASDAAVLVIAAPAASVDLNRVAAGYPNLVAIVDLRSADDRTPLSAAIPTITLDDLFAEAGAARTPAAGRLAAARADIAALGRAFVNRDELRPFGWDDLCA
jgi:glutamyl-tRNA reductase